MTRELPLNRRAALKLSIAASTTALAAPFAFAQSAFPSRPIKLVVPFSAGGVNDIVGRQWAERVKPLLGAVFIENLGGAGGTLGVMDVQRADPDGHSILLGSTSTMVLNTLNANKVSYDPVKDFVPIAIFCVSTTSIAVHPAVPAKNVRELVDYVKANTGKLSYGSAGSGSSPHLAGEMLKRAASINATHVPYKGAAPALNDLLGGQVQFMFAPGPGLQHVATGKLVALGVASGKRAAKYPDIATLDELGVRVDADTTFGVYAPGGTSPAIVERMNREINKTLNSPALIDNMAKLGGDVAPLTIAEFASRQAADRARYGAFIKEAGIKVD